MLQKKKDRTNYQHKYFLKLQIELKKTELDAEAAKDLLLRLLQSILFNSVWINLRIDFYFAMFPQIYSNVQKYINYNILLLFLHLIKVPSVVCYDSRISWLKLIKVCYGDWNNWTEVFQKC